MEENLRHWRNIDITYKQLILVIEPTVASSRRSNLPTWRAVGQDLLWKKTGVIGSISVDSLLAWSKLFAARWWSDISPGALREKKRAFFVKKTEKQPHLGLFFWLWTKARARTSRTQKTFQGFFSVIFCRFLRFLAQVCGFGRRLNYFYEFYMISIRILTRDVLSKFFERLGAGVSWVSFWRQVKTTAPAA